jgi:hypothetical protein
MHDFAEVDARRADPDHGGPTAVAADVRHTIEELHHMRRLHSLSVAVAHAALAVSLAWAGPVGEATLNAVAFDRLPVDAPMYIRVLDDSEENLAIARDLERALAQRGFSIAAGDATLALTIDTGDAVGAGRTTSDTDRVQMRDDRGRLFPRGQLDVTRQVQLPLPRTTVVTPAQYRLGLTIEARGGGGPIWQGWAIADLSQGEPAELARAMVPKLADSIGRTVREEVFALDKP